MPNPPTEQRRQSHAWPIAIAAIAIVGIVAFTAYLAFRQIAQVPAAAVGQAKEGLQAMADLAAEFRKGTIETRFISYVTDVSGSTYLQVASIDRVETYRREDRAAIFWGTVDLPDVVVSVTAPVHYTAYVDLDEAWSLHLEDTVLRVRAPRIRFNPPAIDPSEIRYEVESDSLLRDEESALLALKRELTSRSRARSQDLLPVVRETARAKVEHFVRTWLIHSFPEAGDVRVEVVFADEEDPTAPVLLRSQGQGE